MKKFFAIVVVITMCAVLATCGGKGGSQVEINGEKVEVATYSGDILISKEQMMSFAEVVELTPENAADYLEIKVVEEGKKTYSVVDINLNGAFTYTWLNDADCRYNMIEFAEAESGKTVATKLGMANSEGMQFVNIAGHSLETNEFVKSESKLVLFNIPEELWNFDENGNAYIYFGEVSQESAGVTSLNGGRVAQGDIVANGNIVMMEMLKSYFG